MKGMQKISRGGGFRGAVSYALDRDEEKFGEVIGGNMDGESIEELSAEFKVSRSMRPDCKKPVWHNALRLPKGEKIDQEQWRQIADDYMLRMGFSDDHQRVYVMHDDPEGQHVHIIASRIALDGSLYYGQNENLASTQHIAALEREHGLTISPEPDPATSGQRRRLTRGEIEMAIRTEEAPPKLILQNAIDAALADQPTTGAFIERLQVAGIIPRPNIASTGRMNGFSFELDGIAFKASSLGKSYSFQNLIKRGLDYEQTRDSEILERTAQQSNIRANQRTTDLANAERREPGAADRAFSSSAGSAERRSPDDDRRDRQNVSVAAEADDRGIQRGGEEMESGGGELAARAQGPGRSDSADHQQHRDRKSTVAGSDVEGMGGIPDDKLAVVGGATDRIRDLAAPAVRRRETGGQGLSHTESGEQRTDSGVRAGTDAVAPHIAAKQHAWRQQHDALQAPAYRITLTARRENLQTFNLGKGKGPEGAEKFYTAQEVNDLIPQLSRHNARGYDIYVTPISDRHHYIVLDDSDTDRLKAMQAKTGILPVLVQESSPGNLQAVIVADKAQGRHEQSNANFIVQGLNKAAGDPKFTGAIHPFRMAGFMNQKPVYEQNGKRPIVRPRPGIVKMSPGKADPVLNEMLSKQREQQAEQEQKRRVIERTRSIESFNATSRKSSADDRYLEEASRICKHVDSKGWERDWSRIDYAVACKMIGENYYSNDQIADAIMNNSPGIDERKQNPAYYAKQTVEAAERDPRVQRQLQLEREPEL